MVMEQRLLADAQFLLLGSQRHPRLLSSPHAALQPLLPLITSPGASLPTLSSLLKTLTLQLQCTTTTHLPRIVLSLLSALSDHHPDLRREISLAVRAFALRLLPFSPSSSFAHSLAILFKDADTSSDVTDEPTFLSICFRPCKASLRRWLLQNVDKFCVRPSVLIAVLLGFTKDPYPLTRKAALDGLVWLSDKFVAVEDQSLLQCCYFSAAELLFDAEDSVRCSAVRTVSEWGLLLVESNQDKCKIDWSDALFVQLCSMVRDMSMKVRTEAFDALAKVPMVSQNVLLLTLTKKATSATKEITFPGRYAAKIYKLPASAAAFAFIHGLEDEFFEVRRSACCALRTFAIAYGDFACEAVNLLMDMLNDDSVVVRLLALETMHHMAMYDCLKVQEGHLHMLLGALVDDSTLIRSAAMKILQLIRLHKLAMFKLCFEGLVRNLELYPQDEADLLSVLLNIGQNHGWFVAHLIQENTEKIEPSLGGRLGFESARIVALLVLAISAPVSIERGICSIPPRMYSYAVTLLGRISDGLIGTLNQNDLLSHLSRCSRFSCVSSSEFFRGEESAVPLVKSDTSLYPKNDGIHGSCSQRLLELERVVHPIANYPLKIHDEMESSMGNILQKIHSLWPLIRCGFADEATRTLRSWKKQLKTFTCDSSEPTAELVFVLQYLRTIKLLGRVWIRCMFPLKPCFGVRKLEVLFRKLERSLKEMKYRFLGFSSEQELHILELILVTLILKLSNVKACCPSTNLKEISSVVTRVEHLVGGRSVELSSFVIELQKILREIGPSTAVLENALLLQKSLEYYTLRQFMFSGILVHVAAKLDVYNNYENPLHYVLGLPAGIPIEITLRNISRESRIWLKMTFKEKLAQFVYLDLHGLSGGDECRKFTFVAPFFGPPKARSFLLKISIGMECSSEPPYRSNVCGGPKHELINISGDSEVFLTRVGG
ncbi:protein SIEL [Coffea eugenioides]|uniref:Protein SIEL-like n=1 Tax=Coffea arabica TaxID=13443 RepID=A0ABM4USP6_COFAR|nr:protein SIEL [Coffea eugenioides]XP_027173159.1 protein SIEL [Coffea eugenioides]